MATLVFWLWLTFNIPTLISGRDLNRDNKRKLVSTNPGFISIDCGAPVENPDDSNIYYQTDTGFVSTGTNSPVSSEFIHPGLNMELRTLRYFPQGRKNCYTLKPDEGKTSTYLIRAVFMYGNYDGKNQTPVFQLYLGVNPWITVREANEVYEIIHSPLTDTIQVCLMNNNTGVPYISALELRQMDNIYQISGGTGLALISRINLGGSNKTIRYGDDVYDRIWIHAEETEWTPMAPNFTIDTTSNTFKVPVIVLGTGIKCVTGPINVSWTSKDNSSKFYVYLHFAELEKLKDGKQRTIHIHYNGLDSFDSSSLEYQKAVSIAKPSLTGLSSYSFSISSGDNSLPPILNAYEIYMHKDFYRLPTVQQDVDAIMDITRTYRIYGDWQGDPCLPSPWNILNCTSLNPPNIISLNLSSRDLTGNIADSFSNLRSIQSLDLSNNGLTGLIPEFLAQLPLLTVLNLTGNKLEGAVPKALMERHNSGALTLHLDGNPDLCLMESCKGKKRKIVPIVGASVSVVVLILLCAAAAVVFWIRERKKQGMKIEWSSKAKTWKFSYLDIVNITNNFTSVLGEGGFGKVYHGTLKDSTQVAIKVLSSSSRQGSEEFLNELKLLLGIHHKNVVSLFGYCNEGANMALVYEYLAFGSLQQYLSEVTNTNVLTWKGRLLIAVDAARGLDYLHNCCKPPIVHRDLKTSNILLNEDMQAKIGDFGLCKVFTTENDTHISTDAKGTRGYVDPEYHSTGKLNRKSDVYSFGVVLLELITGLPAIVEGPPPIQLCDWVIPYVERKEIENIVDPRLQSYNINSAWRAIEVAMACLPSLAVQRPDISYVYDELRECLKLEIASEKPLVIEGSESWSSASVHATPLDLNFDMHHTC